MSDPRQFRDALGAFATGVTVITTRDAAGRDVGRTANSFSSVSLSPPMVLWSLARASASHAAFHDATHFAVHVLSAEQADLSARFAGKAEDKFAGLTVARGAAGIPLLHGCTARFECVTRHRYDGGDHVIFVAEVLDFTHDPAPPLLFHGGRYGGLGQAEPV
ncbi:flavin reductase family protein [Cereibacter sp. SYSU M97828]|nr:flavin reductase family protein [Cereibacter flavus]